MSATKRILSGSAGTMAGVLLGFAQRLLVIPVILSFWNAETFGHYLTLMAAMTFVGLLGRSFETILNREFLRVGPDRPIELCRLFGGGLLVIVLVECLAVVIFLGCVFFLRDAVALLRGNWNEFWLVAAAYLISRVLVGFPGATYSGVLWCYGYFPKLTWLGLFGRVLGVVAPVIAVVAGWQPAGVVAAELLAPGLFAPVAWIWLSRWGRASGVWHWVPDGAAAFRVFLKSLQNVLIMGVDLLRGEGLRLVMSPLAGAAALTAFVTMRTGANVALQGLSTITSPVMPELMRFLGQRDQSRTEAAFATVWLLLIGVLVPGVVILQAVADPLFTVWTRGKVPFDGLLFGLMSLGVLVFASAQPAMAVVQGNNLLRSQMLVSVAAGMVVVGGMVALIPFLGLRGAGLSLLAGELLAAVIYRAIAARWMAENDLSWPRRAAGSVFFSVLVAGAALLLMPTWPHLEWGIGLAALAINIFLVRVYWRQLPAFARQRLFTLVTDRLPRSWAARPAGK